MFCIEIAKNISKILNKISPRTVSKRRVPVEIRIDYPE